MIMIIAYKKKNLIDKIIAINRAKIWWPYS